MISASPVTSISPLIRKADLVGLGGAILLITVVWLAAVYLFKAPSYLLPTPFAVAQEMAKSRELLAMDFIVTGGEAVAGFLISSALSLMIATLVFVRRGTQSFVIPTLVVLKSIPVVALVPLVGYWFGYEYGGKIFVASVVAFFPLVVNAISGMRQARPEQVDFFTVMNASRWDVLWQLRLPRAMPSVFAAMRIAAPMAVVGAVFSEMMGARHGLGNTLSMSTMTLDMPLNFAAMIGASALGIIMFYLVLITERIVLRRLRLTERED